MFRVLLLNPPPVNGIRYTREGRCQERESVLGTVKPPLTLAILAAILRNQGVEIRLIDATIESLSSQQVIRRLTDSGFKPDLAVLATTTPTIISDMQAAREIKEAFQCSLAAFGPHVSGVPETTLQDFPWLDMVIVGEPEPVVSRLCRPEGMAEGARIPGLVRRADLGQAKLIAPARVVDLKKLPYPAWDLLPDKAYRLPFFNEPYLMVETSRGCPPACDFCVVSLTHGVTFRERTAVEVADEIEIGYDRFGIRQFCLWADTVTLGRRFILEFAEEMRRRALPVSWLGNARIDTLTSRDIVQKLRESGCNMLSVGVEVADDGIRSSMSKKFGKPQIHAAFRWLREAGILSVSFFILGYLGENLETMQATIDLALSCDPDFAAFYPAVPYPGTPFFAECERRGWIGTRDWSRYDYSDYIISNGVLRRENVLRLQKRAYRQFYLRPKLALRSLRYLTSASAMRQALDLLWSRVSL